MTARRRASPVPGGARRHPENIVVPLYEEDHRVPRGRCPLLRFRKGSSLRGAMQSACRAVKTWKSLRDVRARVVKPATGSPFCLAAPASAAFLVRYQSRRVCRQELRAWALSCVLGTQFDRGLMSHREVERTTTGASSWRRRPRQEAAARPSDGMGRCLSAGLESEEVCVTHWGQFIRLIQ